MIETNRLSIYNSRETRRVSKRHIVSLSLIMNVKAGLEQMRAMLSVVSSVHATGTPFCTDRGKNRIYSTTGPFSLSRHPGHEIIQLLVFTDQMPNFEAKSCNPK